MKSILAVLIITLVGLVSTANATPIKVGEYYTWSDDGYSQYSDNYTLLGTEYYDIPPTIVEHWYRCQHNHTWGFRTHHEQWWDDETFEEWETYYDPEWIDLYWDDDIYWDEFYPGGGGEWALPPEEQ